ncbi:hypothetical protein ACIA8O_02655 [Kitasatospora sp. NPDC051853]|uniref:hypothetical protein n=1 Tax=Kitasatospora sp. NPDC051853 TaxID=3364058 RepID=UPI0037AA2CB3
MSITSPIPVLRGDRDSVLRLDGEALVLSRPHERLRIPLAAVRQVRAEGRSVTVELAAGAPPAVHRIAGVSGAAAAVFAAAVTAALPEHPDEEAVVVTSAVAETRPQRRIRLLKRWALVFGLVVTAVAAATGIATGGLTGIGLGVMSLLLGALGVAMTAVGLGGLWLAHRQRFLLRHGITVEAERLPDEPWTYAYTDTDGVSRSLWAKSGSATLEVAYAPGDPSEVVVRRSAARTARETAFALGMSACGLAALGGVGVLLVGSLQGVYVGG